jgi:flagella basal body P-ring formation protein FlgA
MIRIAIFIVAAVVASAAAAQFADTSLLSPVPLTSEGWAARAAAAPVRATQELPAPAALPALPERAEPSRPVLKRAVTVTGEIVRIGDLVENAGVVAEVPIFRAPDLGHSGSVPAARVLDAVRPHHIIQLDTSGIDEVMVTRASRTVTTKEVEARLVSALSGQSGLTDAKNIGVSFDGNFRTVQVDPNAELGITQLSYNQQTRRFDVAFDLAGNGGRRQTLRVTGALVETTEAVVPLRTIAPGEVLKASDVMIERRPKTDAVAIEDAIGFAARHSLKPGQVIRPSDLMKPELVARNETVTISYEAPGMVLSIRGKALDAGAKGDVVNVLNIQSNRTIQATVSGPGRVYVTGTSARLVSNAPTAAPGNPQR